MWKKYRSVSLSAFLVLAVIALGLFSVQGYQVTQPTVPSSQHVPPPPSAPFWTYKTRGSVEAVAVSRDGSTVLAGGSYPDHKVYAFGSQDNTTLWTYNFTVGSINSVAVSDNGSTIVAGGYQYVRVFGRQSNTTIWTYKSSSSINSVAISADGNTIVAGTDDGYVYVFGRQNNATIWKYNTNLRVYSVAVSADGTTIVSGDGHYSPYYGYVRVFSRLSNITMWTYKAGSYFYGVAVSANGSTIVAGCDNFMVYVLGRQSNTTVWTFKTGNPAQSVGVSADGNTIAATSRNGNLTVFARATNMTLVNYNTNSILYNAMAVSSDGLTIACGGWGKASWGMYSKARLFSRNLGLLWDYNVGGNISTSIYGPAVAISGDGTLAAYGSDNNEISVFQYDYAPPVLGSPDVSPSSPVQGQNINISISVTDNIGVNSVSFYYKVDNSGSWTEVTTSHTATVYKAIIGPYSAGTNVTYYFDATDTSGNYACSPSSAPTAYYSFTVGQAPPGGGGIDPILIIIPVVAVVAVVVIVAIVTLTRRGNKSKR